MILSGSSSNISLTILRGVHPGKAYGGDTSSDRSLTFEVRVPGVDNDAVVAHIHERRPRGIVLAREDACDLGSETADRLALGIDDEPFAAVARSLPLGKYVLITRGAEAELSPIKRTHRIAKAGSFGQVRLKQVFRSKGGLARRQTIA